VIDCIGKIFLKGLKVLLILYFLKIVILYFLIKRYLINSNQKISY
jgi:hypothetical protein